MKLTNLAPDEVLLASELSRSTAAKTFEDRLRSSIDEIGLVEPLKVARRPDGRHVIVDGAMRLRAIQSIRATDVSRFASIPVYLVEYERRFEIRYQSDIYQDLLPSQLASLVEHLARSEKVRKTDIARYIGVSSATLRNYTGLWRLLERGGTFAKIVDLMDARILPASNPYAWLRLTSEGLELVLAEHFAQGVPVSQWIESTLRAGSQGGSQRYPLAFVESVTSGLAANYYRTGEEVRAEKRKLGLRRAVVQPQLLDSGLKMRLEKVADSAIEPVLVSAAKSLQEYLS